MNKFLYITLRVGTLSVLIHAIRADYSDTTAIMIALFTVLAWSVTSFIEGLNQGS